MLNLSPAAQMFWGSIIRHLLSFVGGVLVAHGYVTQTGASAYTEELVGVIINGAVLVWSNRTAYWQQIKLLVALMLPKGSTQNDVTAHIASGAVLPVVTTPPDTAPGVPAPK